MNKKTILLIEDNDAVRENTAEILEISGYNIICAENGKIGVEKAKEYNPDLIICDVLMPELDGHGVLHILSKNPSTKSIPFIFLTAKADKSDFRKGMKLGADDYITKPYNELDLLETIERRLQRIEDIKSNTISNNTDVLRIPYINKDAGYTKLKKSFKNQNLLEFKAEQAVFIEGKVPGNIYLVEQGTLKKVLTNEYGKILITEFYSKGDFIGLEEAFNNEKHRANIKAFSDVVVREIKKSDFDKLIHSDIEISAFILKLIAQKYLYKEQLLISLAYDSVRRRLANTIHFISEKLSSNEIHISRTELAQMVGTTKESIIRNLSDFKSENLILVEGNKIEILRKSALLDIIA